MSDLIAVAIGMIEPARFPLGRIVATLNALNDVPNDEIVFALAQHSQGDWGELDLEDKQANDRALTDGTRLLSAYNTKSGTRFWIITEHDRSIPTILLPEDY
jgi:hypothetical protein